MVFEAAPFDDERDVEREKPLDNADAEAIAERFSHLNELLEREIWPHTAGGPGLSKQQVEELAAPLQLDGQ